MVLALTALGEDPGSAAGYDLLSPWRSATRWCARASTGPSGPSSPSAPRPGTAWDVQSGALVEAGDVYLSAILAAQLSDGGWSLSGKTRPDPDITAMACAPWRHIRKMTP